MIRGPTSEAKPNLNKLLCEFQILYSNTEMPLTSEKSETALDIMIRGQVIAGSNLVYICTYSLFPQFPHYQNHNHRSTINLRQSSLDTHLPRVVKRVHFPGYPTLFPGYPTLFPAHF